jgi:hypothetical protein
VEAAGEHGALRGAGAGFTGSSADRQQSEMVRLASPGLGTARARREFTKAPSYRPRL